MIQHGGNLDKAIKLYGGNKNEWIDLSTGINPDPYNFPAIKSCELRDLPTSSDIQSLEELIKTEFKTNSEVVLTPGSQIAINLLPFLMKIKKVGILSPTYEDYAFIFKNSGFSVTECKNLNQLIKTDVAIIVNPNNPDGRIYTLKELLNLSQRMKLLIIDESFIEASDAISVMSYINKHTSNIIVIKSFGKFFGLAGLRLGFVFSGKEIIDKFRFICGAWPVSSIAIKIASKALKDGEWIKYNKINLFKRANSLDKLLREIDFKNIGGTTLFRLYSTENNVLAQKMLAKKYIWTRAFTYSKKWLRIGIPSEKDFKKIKKIIMSL